MAEDNEIVAVFRADIEQYKKDVQEAVGITGTLDKKVEQTSATTQKFDKHTKGAASSVSTLSRGLGGVAGLLGITGRLFGVNTDKLEGFIFASKEFIKVARDVSHAQHLSNLATKSGIAAKEADIVATEGQTVAQRLYAFVVGESVGAMAAFKVALAATGIGLAVIALTTLVSSFQAAKKATEDKEKAAKKLREENNKLNESIAEVQKKEDDLALSRGVTTKQITERQAAEIAATSKNLERQTGINKERRIKINADGKVEFIEDDAFKKKMAVAERDYQAELGAIREKFDKLDAEAKKKEAEKSLAEREASLQKEFNAFVKYWDDVDKKNRDAQKAILEEQKKFADNKQKLLEEEFVEEQDSAAKNRKIAEEASLKNLELLRALKEVNSLTPEQAKALEGLEKELNNKRIDQAKQVADAIFKAQQEAFDKKQELLKEEQTLQEKQIDVQRGLAERGLENTLAFEQKRSAELARQQQIDAQKQKRVKLLETFLNSLAEYSKTDPKNAINKALLQVALATAASAVFAEEGGIIGEIGERSIGGRRRHKGGGDVLLHAQTGEGILSRREMDNLGKRNFHLLKDAARFPIRDDVFGMPKIAMVGGTQVSNTELIKEVKGLRNDIRNQKRESWEVDKFGAYIKTSIENGVTEVTKGKMPKPRFK